MAEQLKRSGYNTRDEVQDQRFDAYFNPDSPVDPNANPVTPTDFSRLEQLFQQPAPPKFSINYDAFAPKQVGTTPAPDLSQYSFDHELGGYRDPTTGFPISFPEAGPIYETPKASSGFTNSLSSLYGLDINKPFFSAFNNDNKLWSAALTNPEFERLYNTPDDQLDPAFKYLKNNPKDFGEYITRWGPGENPFGGGFFQYSPEAFVASRGPNTGVDPSLGEVFKKEQSPEAQASRHPGSRRTEFFKDAAKFYVTNALPLIAPMLGPVAAGVSSVAKAAVNKDPLAAVGGLAGIAGGTGVISPSMASGIKSVAGIGNAVLKKNPFGAITSGLGLANNGSLQSMFNNTSGGSNMDDYLEFDDWGSQSNLGGNNAFPSQNPVDDPLGAYLMENNQQYGDAGLDPNSFYGQQVFSGTPNWASNFGRGGAQQNMDGSQGQQGGFMNDLLKKGGYLETAAPMVGALGNIFLRNQQNKQLGGLSNQMMQSMDPFGAQRPQYQQALSQTYTNPSLYMNSPEHQAIQKRMRDELEKKDAAGGRRSQYGARSVQLQEAALANLFKQREQLGGFAGAQIAPNAQMGANAMLGQQAVGQNQMGSLADIMRGIQDYGKTRNGQPYGMQQQVTPY